MTPSADEIDELRKQGQALNLDNIGGTVLETLAEQLGFFIYEWRHLGADQDELLHDLELLIRASDLDATEIREARDTLKTLAYGADITRLLTALARRAPSKAAYRLPGLGWTTGSTCCRSTTC